MEKDGIQCIGYSETMYFLPLDTTQCQNKENKLVFQLIHKKWEISCLMFTAISLQKQYVDTLLLEPVTGWQSHAPHKMSTWEAG